MVSLLTSNGARHTSIGVVLVDHEPSIQATLSQALAEDGLDVIGEAAGGEAAVELVVALRPDVVLLDIDLPGMSGLETIHRLSRLAPASKVLVLARPEENRVVEAIIAGACGYILKTAPPDAISSAVRATAAGECVVSSEVAGKLVEHIRNGDLPVVATSEIADAVRTALTTRELEIFTLLAGGGSNQQIADGLSISVHTVRNHVKRILAKLHLANRIQAAAHAVRAGIS